MPKVMWKFNFTCFRLKICSQQTGSWLVIYENVDIVHMFIEIYRIVKYFESDFQQYFSYIVAVSFIGGGNRRNP
jgi:hypothetical protein